MIKKHVITGLVILLPLFLTLWILGALIQWLTGPCIGITETMLRAAGLQEKPFLFMNADAVLLHVSQLVAMVVLIISVIIIGTLGRHYLLRPLATLSDAVIHKIPLIGSIYSTTHDLINALTSHDASAFNNVVLVPFPNSDCYSIGLVTSEGPVASHLIPVFIPATPNPLHGYVLLFKRSQIVTLDMSVEEAFRCIISCGALLSQSPIQQQPAAQRSALS